VSPRKRGFSKLDIKERFERAGLTDEYDSVYQMLSAEAHNNISHLRSRYFCLIDDRIVLRKTVKGMLPGHRYEHACTLSISEIVIRSTEKLLRRCGHGVAVLSDANRKLERKQQLARAQDGLDPPGE
jgi:hypothetical protein